MNKVYWGLQSRLDAVKKRAEQYTKHDPQGAYKSALEWQVKYGRKGWNKYGNGGNDYDEVGNMRLYNLDAFDAIELQDISRRAFDYTGYYSDNFQHDLIKPKVVRIKTSRGYFIAPATEHSDWDDAVIYLSDGRFAPKDENALAYDAAMMEAARIADRIAERDAERCREDDAKFQAEGQIEDLKHENKEARLDARNLLAEIREQRAAGDIRVAVCEVLIEKVKSYRAQIQANNRRIEKLNDNFWEAVA